MIPHGHSTPAGLHFTLAQSPILTPYQEYLVKWNAINQFFLAHRLQPANGVLAQPTEPGLGMDLDDARIEAKVELDAERGPPSSQGAPSRSPTAPAPPHTARTWSGSASSSAAS